MNCGNWACSICQHAYIEYPYDACEDDIYFCGLHGIGIVKGDFFCKTFELVDKTKLKNIRFGDLFRKMNQENSLFIRLKTKCVDGKIGVYNAIEGKYEEMSFDEMIIPLFNE